MLCVPYTEIVRSNLKSKDGSTAASKTKTATARRSTQRRTLKSKMGTETERQPVFTSLSVADKTTIAHIQSTTLRKQLDTQREENTVVAEAMIAIINGMYRPLNVTFPLS